MWNKVKKLAWNVVVAVAVVVMFLLAWINMTLFLVY